MKDVIQVFKSQHCIRKEHYSAFRRSMQYSKPKAVESDTGYYSNEILYLPQYLGQDPDLGRADVVVIQDIEGYDPFELRRTRDELPVADWFSRRHIETIAHRNLQHSCFNVYAQPWFFELFEFRKSGPECIELWLIHLATEGFPARDGHKIADLKKGVPIRYRVNAKTDFEHWRREQRMFIEYEYVLEFLGSAGEYRLEARNRLLRTKTLPQSCKTVDERRILY